jgi:tricorn protease
MRRILSLTVLLCLFSVASITAYAAPTSVADDTKPGFFRYPHISGEWIVFTSEGDLWKVKASGGTAIRLTTAEGEERFPKFSADGQWIAFTGQEDGHDDVFVMPSTGGSPRRLTYHPDRDQVVGWDPQGNILFRSMREMPHYEYRIYRLPKEGGYPESIGLHKAANVSYEPKGSRIAFNTVALEFRTWKRYQGGWAQDIYVGDLKKLDFKKVTEEGVLRQWQGNYGSPMWHTDGRIYFLSDRDGRGNIWSMKPDASDIKQHTLHKEFDARFPALGEGRIVYQNGMDVWMLDIASGKDQKVDIQLPTDRLQARIKFIEPKRYIQDFELSPDAKRLLLCSRGELFTAPTKGEGLVRQLTASSGIREKFPRYSPDGVSIAAWSDATGEEKLYIYPAGGGAPKLLGTDGRGWHFGGQWSPDGKNIAFANEECELVLMDAASGKNQVIDHAEWEIRDYAWSADSRYLTYSTATPNYLSVIKIFDTQEKKATAVTDDFTNAYNPKFTDDGKYLVFLSDREANPRLDNMEVTYILDERTRPYMISLKAGTAFPFAPEADPESDDNDDEMHDKKDSDKGDKADKK